MVPESCVAIPVMQFIVEVLPAPLGPRNPKNSPFSIENEIPSMATFAP
jgi:hypothetical protein